MKICNYDVSMSYIKTFNNRCLSQKTEKTKARNAEK